MQVAVKAKDASEVPHSYMSEHLIHLTSGSDWRIRDLLREFEEMNQIEPPNFTGYSVKIYTARDGSHYVSLDSRLSGFWFNFLMGWLCPHLEGTAGWWSTEEEFWHVVADKEDQDTLLLIKPNNEVFASNFVDNSVYPLPDVQRSHQEAPKELGKLVTELQIELDEGEGLNPKNLITDETKAAMIARTNRQTIKQFIVVLFCFLLGGGVVVTLFSLAVIGFINFMAWLFY